MYLHFSWCVIFSSVERALVYYLIIKIGFVH